MLLPSPSWPRSLAPQHQAALAPVQGLAGEGLAKQTQDFRGKGLAHQAPDIIAPEDFARQQPARFRRTGTGNKGRVQCIDIK